MLLADPLRSEQALATNPMYSPTKADTYCGFFRPMIIRVGWARRRITLKAAAEVSLADLRRRSSGLNHRAMICARLTIILPFALIGAFAAYDPVCAAGVTPDAPMSLDVLANRADPRLPVGAPARIVIRYFSENAAARARATDLAHGLGEQGLDVADLVASPERIANSTVSYFYLEDRPGAEIAARGLGPAWRSVQQRLPVREPFPRPGALELAVAGP